MAIFRRYKIDRYKEVVVNQPEGLVSDGGFSTYTLDQNSDFLGVIKNITLIGEVTEITMEGADWVAIAAGGMAESGGLPTHAFRILRVIVHFDDLWDLLITMSKQDWRKESGKEF